MTTKYAAAYLRKSSAQPDVIDPATGAVIRPGSPGDASDAAQREACRGLAAAYTPGVELREFRDWGVSGRKDDRKAYQALKAAIAAGEVCCVYAYALDRLGRSTSELLAFFALCRAHGVTVTTQREGKLGHDSPFGEFMLTVLSAIAQLESGLARERTRVARDARQARQEAAGALIDGKLPGQIAPYGWRHVKRDGVIVREPDPERPIDPVLAAYREAGSIRGASVLLNARGVPPPRRGPKGGREWSLGSLARVLDRCARAGLIDMPRKVGRAGRRPVNATRTALAGLVYCHCGRRMTPIVDAGRNRLYCSRGHATGVAAHGPYNASEGAILPVLQAEAARFVRTGSIVELRDAAAGERAKIERKIANLKAMLDVFEVTPDEYKSAVLGLKAKLAALETTDDTVVRLAKEPVPSWEDTEAMNRHLRRLWTAVRLDREMRPTVEWAIPIERFDEAALAAHEAEIDEVNRS